jgi:hypothetical protein
MDEKKVKKLIIINYGLFGIFIAAAAYYYIVTPHNFSDLNPELQYIENSFLNSMNPEFKIIHISGDGY